MKVNGVSNMSNELELLDDEFVKIVKDIEKDILDTRYNIISKANKEVIDFYLRLGKSLVIMQNMAIILSIDYQ